MLGELTAEQINAVLFNEVVGRMRPASQAGIAARFDRCAPTATNTAAKPPFPPLGLEILHTVVELEVDS